jgi:proteasome lid subunit RPN8/RPN11
VLPDESDQFLPEGVLRFTPAAWAKLYFFCHAGETEIGGFGLTDPDDPLLVTDFLTVRQSVTAVSVEFDDQAVADLFEEQVDQGRRPDQFARIWCHTHPGNCPEPSGTDEETFARVFGSCDWAVMFILAKGGQTYCRLGFNAGPGGAILLHVAIDYGQTFTASNHAAWSSEYDAHIQPACGSGFPSLFGADHDPFFDPEEWVDARLPLDPDQMRARIEMLAEAGYDPDEMELLLDDYLLNNNEVIS